MTFLRTALVVIISLALLPQSLSAHHSRSEFAKEFSEIEGELIKVYWRNPHAGLDVRLTNEDGSSEVWRVETYGSPNLFSRMGVKREHFVVGEKITVAGNISTRRPKYILGSNVLFESGMETLDWDAIICVSSSDELIFQRLEKRGIERDDAEQRVRSQMPLENKEQRSDYVVPNGGTLNELEESTRATVNRIMVGR